MTDSCRATTKKGTPCVNKARSNGYCVNHQPVVTGGDSPALVALQAEGKRLDEGQDPAPLMSMAPIMEQLNNVLMAQTDFLTTSIKKMEETHAHERELLYGRLEREDAVRAEHMALFKSLQEQVSAMADRVPESSKRAAEENLQSMIAEERRKIANPQGTLDKLRNQVYMNLYVDSPDLVRTGLTMNGCKIQLRLGEQSVPKDVYETYMRIRGRQDELQELEGIFSTTMNAATPEARAADRLKAAVEGRYGTVNVSTTDMQAASKPMAVLASIPAVHREV